MMRGGIHRTTIYYARISLIRTLFDYDKKSASEVTEYISQLINRDLISTNIKGAYEWHFGNIEDTADYLYCKLGKLRTKGKTTRFDDLKKQFIEVESEDKDAFISHILFDKKNHLILFEERPELGYKELKWTITEAVQRQFQKVISIDILPNKIELTKILNDAYRVTKAKFLLKPSNPDNSEDLKKMDDLIRDVRAKRAKMEFDNEEGLDFKNSKNFKSALSLSNRGFGTFNLDYEYIDGVKRKFNSSKKILKETIPKPPSEERWKNKLKEMLKQAMEMLDKK